MDKNKANVPKIRFPGFTDPWEQRKLGSIANVIDPHPSHRAPAATDDGIPFIGIGDVDEEGNIDYKNARIVDEKIYDEHHNRYDLSVPSIGIGRVASLGKVIRLRNDIGKYAVSPTMSVIQFYSENDLDYLYACMNTPVFQKQFKSFSNGSTRQSVGIQDLRKLMLDMPIDLEEQQKIGEFFDRLDHLITLHQRKLNHLKDKKKSLLQKMFPKNGESFPELRFPGFTDPWEQRKLGEVAERVTRKNKDLESTLPLTISAQDGLVDQNMFFNKTVASRDVSGYYLVKNGEFAYNKSYSNGYPWGAVKRLDRYDMGVLSTLYIVFKLTDVNSDFLTKYYDTTYWYHEVSKHAAEGARNHGLLNIAASDFFETELTIPKDKAEQEKIGRFFNNIDHLITLHQRKLNHLKEQKKALLQQMFI